jgi:hypothetical protein
MRMRTRLRVRIMVIIRDVNSLINVSGLCSLWHFASGILLANWLSLYLKVMNLNVPSILGQAAIRLVTNMKSRMENDSNQEIWIDKQRRSPSA